MARPKVAARKSTGGKAPAPNSPYWWTLDSDLLKSKRPGEFLTSPIFVRWGQKFRMQVDPGSGPRDPARLSLQLLHKPTSLPFRVRIKYSFANWRRYDVDAPGSSPAPFEHVFDDDYNEANAVCAVYAIAGDFDSICCEIEKVVTEVVNPPSRSADSSPVEGPPPCKKPFARPATPAKPLARPATPATFLRSPNFDTYAPLIDYVARTSPFEFVEETAMSNNDTPSPIADSQTSSTNDGLNLASNTRADDEQTEPEQTRRSLRKSKQITMKLPTFSASASAFAATASTSTAAGPNNSHINLCNDFGELLLSGKYSDIVLVARDSRDAGYDAHKAIISSRSSVFSQLCELCDKEIVLNDVSSEVLKKLLIFMYSGYVDDLENCVIDVFLAAEKYALHDLKDMCVQSMRNNLSSDNAADTLIIAHKYELEELKACTMEFMNKNATQVIKTPGYKKILESHKDLVADLYHSLISTSSQSPGRKSKSNHSKN